jgi:SAM-dependent methyltransferase
MRRYGGWLHGRVQRRRRREMYHGTFFLRNRPALELMSRIVEEKDHGSRVDIAVLGCSIGVEVYSILWMLRRARPDLEVVVQAVDTAGEVIEIAESGVYGPAISEQVGSQIFERLTERELEDMFDWDGDTAHVKPWLKEGVEWRVDDACDPELAARLGPQDFVVASNFLCHMDPVDAESCLRNTARLVKPDGHIFVTGVDLDVRTRVARDLSWEPVPELLEAVHEGDPSVRGDWPWHWWGLEPLDDRRPDWRLRYAAAFRVGAVDPGARTGTRVGTPGTG